MTNVEIVKKEINNHSIEATNKQTGEICVIGMVREELYSPDYAIAIYCGADDGSDDYITSEEDFNENFFNITLLNL